jgi:hypothetical protein
VLGIIATLGQREYLHRPVEVRRDPKPLDQQLVRASRVLRRDGSGREIEVARPL